ncbi:MAG: D-alanyl-D-alanine carboxypeptidase [Cyanobacteria bacterium CRU_2_1]|nr:D-alanyl-D-alanine carboxypeptidase [Cyanobacteria bacterium CRU_2_1]
MRCPKQIRYWLQFITVLLIVIGIAGGVGNFSHANTAIAQTAQINDNQTESTGDFVQDRLNGSLCPNQLGSVLDRIVENPVFAEGRWGILVEPLSSRETLYSYKANDLLIPASNVKLLTTAAALQLNSDDSDNRSALESWIETINRYSDNDYADALLDQIGGTDVVKEALSLLGVDPDSYQQVDGSGLSRNNLAEPLTFVALLKAMRFAQGNEIFYNSLAVAGVSGTLEGRFQGTSVEGRVHAKTGTLSGVRALSGYLENPDYGTIVFSIMINQPGQYGQFMVQTIDQIVLQLARLSPCD